MKTKIVKVGNILIGGDNPIRVQSMITSDASYPDICIKKINELEKWGCEIVRLSVINMEGAKNISKIKAATNIPIVADIHFDYKLAIECAKQGIDKIRINPGNIGDKKKVKEIVKICKEKKIPIRIGVNCGSLKAIKKYDTSKWDNNKWANQMVKEAEEEINILKDLDFNDIIVSLKADDIERTVLANEIFASKYNIPLHLGVTEAGTIISGIVKSTIAISHLLKKGIGSTIRISLTEDPKFEVRVAFEILKALGLRKYGPDIISCPTCGRTQSDVISIVKKIEEEIYSNPVLRKKSEGKKIAIMGCIVNGPGEAKYADFGICGGKGKGVFIEKGKISKVIKENEWVNEIIRKIRES
jgi:(E)-4-hydroxy-3-methylbut-2-enyl-diphosphate synthase